MLPPHLPPAPCDVVILWEYKTLFDTLANKISLYVHHKKYIIKFLSTHLSSLPIICRTL